MFLNMIHLVADRIQRLPGFIDQRYALHHILRGFGDEGLDLLGGVG